MTAVKKVSIFGSLIIIISIGGWGIYEWIAKDTLNSYQPSSIFF